MLRKFFNPKNITSALLRVNLMTLQIIKTAKRNTAPMKNLKPSALQKHFLLAFNDEVNECQERLNTTKNETTSSE
jgi:hypothetical protein